jgi:hypothetical protein
MFCADTAIKNNNKLYEITRAPNSQLGTTKLCFEKIPIFSKLGFGVNNKEF